MVNRIRLKVMRKKPTMNDLVQANPGKNARVVVHAAMDGARKEQNALLKKAAELAGKLSNNLPNNKRSPEERSEAARKAVNARWAKSKKN